MKRITQFSLVLNVLFIFILGYILHNLDGSSFLKNKIKNLNGSNSVINKKTPKPSWYFKNNSYWLDRKLLFETMPNQSGEIIFLGNSLTDRCEWSELFNNASIKNRGIDGDNTEGVLHRLKEITESSPKKIFINIGTNDLALKMSIDNIYLNFNSIIDGILFSSPKTKIYIQSVLPVTNNSLRRNNDSILKLNIELKKLAQEKKLIYINLYDEFIDLNGKLNSRFSNDGLHLNGQGYLEWKRNIEEYVNE